MKRGRPRPTWLSGAQRSPKLFPKPLPGGAHGSVGSDTSRGSTTTHGQARPRPPPASSEGGEKKEALPSSLKGGFGFRVVDGALFIVSIITLRWHLPRVKYQPRVHLSVMAKSRISAFTCPSRTKVNVFFFMLAHGSAGPVLATV